MLQGLLANYGNEFASAVVSEDGENAIIMGEMAYPLCAMECEGLPGMWQLPSIDQLGLIWEEVNAPSTLTWLIKDSNGGDGAQLVKEFGACVYIKVTDTCMAVLK